MFLELIIREKYRSTRNCKMFLPNSNELFREREFVIYKSIYKGGKFNKKVFCKFVIINYFAHVFRQFHRCASYLLKRFFFQAIFERQQDYWIQIRKKASEVSKGKVINYYFYILYIFSGT